LTELRQCSINSAERIAIVPRYGGGRARRTALDHDRRQVRALETPEHLLLGGGDFDAFVRAPVGVAGLCRRSWASGLAVGRGWRLGTSSIVVTPCRIF
jgi:hypothetical protein